MPRGGKREGAGNKPKLPHLRNKKLAISIQPDLYAKLKAHGQPSKLIQKLLAEYFKESEK